MGNNSKIRKTFVRQQDQSDCGVACLLSIIRYYGGEDSLENLRVKSGTTKEGTTMLGLQHAAMEYGFESDGYVANPDDLIEHDQPVILHVQPDSSTLHYIVCYKWDGNHFIIGDPAKGIRKITLAELETCWVTRKCLTMQPLQNFKAADFTKKEKSAWIIQLVKQDINVLLSASVIGVFIAFLGLSVSFFSQSLIDHILPDKEEFKLISGMLMITFLLVIRVLLSSLRQVLLNRQSKDFNERLIGDFFSKSLHLPLTFFESRKTGDFTARLNDSSRIQRVISQLFGSVIIDLLVVSISLIFLFSYHWYIGVFCIVYIPLLWVAIFRFQKPVFQLQKETMQHYAVTESNYIDTINSIAEIKNGGKEKYFSDKNQKIYISYQEKIYQLLHLNMQLNLFVGIGSVIYLIAIIGFGAFLVFEDTLLVGQFMAIIGISSNILPSAINLAMLLIPINEAKVAFDRVFEFYSIPNQESAENLSLDEHIEAIKVSDLCFNFPGRSELLESINLSLNKGELVALTGENGGGKSTLLSILMGNYKYQEGQIVINNTIPLENIKRVDWKKKTAFVTQNPGIINATVLENIVLDELGESHSKDVMDFCIHYGFHQYFSRLPQGYLTLLGEDGIHLSGGQKQLLALARAIYRNPEILLLDEVSSVMDKDMEFFVIQLLQKIKKNKLILLISHKENIIAEADKVYLLKGKNIGELTKHNMADFWKG